MLYLRDKESEYRDDPALKDLERIDVDVGIKAQSGMAAALAAIIGLQ
jgi:hypothetical protein